LKKLIQIGAGNIGRSFIGERFSSAGYEVVFVDVDHEVVEALNERGAYRVVIKHNEGADEILEVSGVRAVDGRDMEAVRDELVDADCIATSVGMSALPKVAPMVAAGIRLRAETGAPPIDVILAENIRDSAALFRGYLDEILASDPPEVLDYLEQSVGLVETSIGKMVPIMTDDDRAADPLWVFAEPYNSLIVDGTAFRGELPAIDTLKPGSSITAYVDRKLFVHNLGHAATAYLGYLAHPNTEYLYELLEEKGIRESVRAAMQQSADALHAAYTTVLLRDELGGHIDDLLYRFTNRSLKDTVYRVGRDLQRKLGRNDRIVGAALLSARHGLPINRIADVAAAAIRFRATDEHGSLFADDAEFVRRYDNDLESILCDVCDLSEATSEEDRIVGTAVRRAYESRSRS